MYRVLLLQGGQIYCCTLLTPEIGMETFFKEGGVSGPFKKSKKSPECSVSKDLTIDTNHTLPPLPFLH